MSVSEDSVFTRAFTPLLFRVERADPPYCYRCPLGLERARCQIDCLSSLEAALERHGLRGEPHYEGIEMPRNTATGVVTAFFATLVGFAMIWHIWWMMLLGLAGAFATFVAFAWRDRSEVMVPAGEVAALDRANRAARTVALGQPRTFP